MPTPTRQFQETAAAGWFRHYATVPLWFALFGGMQLGRVLETWWGATLGLLATGLFVWLMIDPPVARRTRRLLRDLHRRLPWLAPGVPTWIQPANAEELLATLRVRHDVAVHELDGSTIATIDDLANVLGARFGALKFPADPVRRAVQTLALAGGDRKLVNAIVWHHAEQLAQRDPAGFGRLQAAFALEPGAVARSALFLVVPAPAPVPTAAGDGPTSDRPPVEPDVAVLASAPSRAWWRLRLGDPT